MASRMVRLTLFSFFLLLPLTIGCSNKSMYQAAQENRKQSCIKEPTPDLQQRCLEQLEESYEDYEKKRQEALKK